MMRALVLTTMAMVLGGCAHASLDAKWSDDALRTYDPAKYPDDAAVALYAKDATLLVRSINNPYTQQLVHRVFALQSESSFDLAEVRINLHGKAQLKALKARHFKPDGKVVELKDSEVIADESSAGGNAERASNARLFRLGDVAQGSVIEYVYVVEYPYLEWQDESAPMGEYPIRRYEASVESSKEMLLEGRFYNIPVQTQSGAGRSAAFHRISASMQDLPASPKREAYAGDWTFHQPRWAYRTLRVQNKGQLPWTVYETWDDVAEGWSVRGWNSEKNGLFEGFTERVDMAGCDQPGCFVERATAFLSQRTEYTGVGNWRDSRRATEVLASREASAFERALLMRRLLEDAGLRAELAAYTAPHSSHHDKTFPTMSRFNRLLVYLPEQRGAKALWVDPACLTCGVGEVSDEANGIEALTFHAIMLPMMDPVYDSAFVKVQAPTPTPANFIVTEAATVLPDGTTRLEVQTERTGRLAARRCAELRKRNDQQRIDAARGDALELAATAKLIDTAAPVCGASSKETARFELPQHAVVDEGRLLVPLTLLPPDWDDVFTEEKRLQPIIFESSAMHREYTLTVEVPPGYSLASATAKTSKSAPGLTASYVTRATPKGAVEVKLAIDSAAGHHAASEYARYRAVADFIRSARSGVLELVKK